MAIQFLMVFLGGGLGCVLRFVIAKAMIQYESQFPWATLTANAISCIVLGLILGVQLKHGISDNSKLFLLVGFCGGFSTFSTFSNETLQLFQSGSYLAGIANILGSIILCIVCIFVGIKVTG